MSAGFNNGAALVEVSYVAFNISVEGRLADITFQGALAKRLCSLAH